MSLFHKQLAREHSDLRTARLSGCRLLCMAVQDCCAALPYVPLWHLLSLPVYTLCAVHTHMYIYKNMHSAGKPFSHEYLNVWRFLSLLIGYFFCIFCLCGILLRTIQYAREIESLMFYKWSVWNIHNFKIVNIHSHGKN